MGGCTNEQPLSGGLTGRAVSRVTCADGRRFVVKAAVHPREAEFYTGFAPALNARGIGTPRLEHLVEDEAGTHLLLEHIPHPLPEDRWHADAGVLETLRTLHRATGLPEPRHAFRPAWTAAMNRHALEHLPAPLEGKLEALRESAQHLFEPAGLISGDPNPMNWGLRDAGSPVLFDWDRFGLGTPALDLAITVPGLGSRADYERTAARYAGEAEAPSPLARDVALAKVWVIVEIIGFIDSPAVAERMGWFLETIPAWLEEL